MKVGIFCIITITLQQLQTLHTQSFQPNTKTNPPLFQMQFLAIVSIALAGLASAASVPEKRTAIPPGCIASFWNDGSDGSTGGWGCNGGDGLGNCGSFYWKTSPPYWSVSKTIKPTAEVCEEEVLITLRQCIG